MWKQWLIAVVLVAVVAAGAGIYLNLESGDSGQSGGKSQASAVNVVTPEWQRVRDTVGAVANLRALNSVELTTEVSGRVMELNLQPGAAVAQGAVLLRLDDRQARADLAVIEAQLADARRQYERAQRLRANNSISQSQVDELRTAVDVAIAQREAARVRLQNHRIEAPFAGVVGLSDISVGAFLQAGTTITTLDTNDKMELNFAVPERFIGQVRIGQRVRATSHAFPGEIFEGELVELATRINELSRTLSVRALIDNSEGRLRPGQFMSASLTLQEREGLVIPEQAVMIRGDQKYVFVAEDGAARRVSVRTGSRMPGMVEVVEGLSADDQVVVTGQDRLSTGDRLRLLESDLAIPDNRFISSRES
ncbi:efflux RND transporter periplasmic adaptor subunit [Marinobacter sp. LQ44]|uniref:efflux RND transporter periplasmic adaptor subunit n=1 Tax=unclassified Marinobacter TaxID=83889 RepID=UPI000718DE4E|nr:efflux RND transporter periplasmic adaptor subunit [Marinobacter sp. LQ44]AMQ89155.1 efflux transporter periplasmic adaptor subunit [Marinobacter sp. LQ44]